MNEIEQQRVINLMTNWQRHQWAKAGYRSRDILKFANMVRPYRVDRANELLRDLAFGYRIGKEFGL